MKALTPILPAEASIRNPLDMVASATPASYAKALAAMLDGLESGSADAPASAQSDREALEAALEELLARRVRL